MNQTTQLVNSDFFSLLGRTGMVVQFVLLLLVMTSIFCWAIVWMKHRSLKLAQNENYKFLDLFWNGKSLEEIFHKSEAVADAPLTRVYRAGFKELTRLTPPEAPPGSSPGPHELETIERSLARSSQEEVLILEKHLSWLATTASTAPFVGLFGTVWGILNSFREIGASGSANLAVVAPGISEALIATAVGLAAAIPAVVFYNHFLNRIKRISVDLDSFSKDYLNLVQRKFYMESRKR